MINGLSNVTLRGSKIRNVRVDWWERPIPFSYVLRAWSRFCSYKEERDVILLAGWDGHTAARLASCSRGWKEAETKQSKWARSRGGGGAPIGVEVAEGEETVPKDFPFPFLLLLFYLVSSLFSYLLQSQPLQFFPTTTLLFYYLFSRVWVCFPLRPLVRVVACWLGGGDWADVYLPSVCWGLGPVLLSSTL